MKSKPFTLHKPLDQIVNSFEQRLGSPLGLPHLLVTNSSTRLYRSETLLTVVSRHATCIAIAAIASVILPLIFCINFPHGTASSEHQPGLQRQDILIHNTFFTPPPPSRKKTLPKHLKISNSSGRQSSREKAKKVYFGQCESGEFKEHFEEDAIKRDILLYLKN